MSSSAKTPDGIKPYDIFVIGVTLLSIINLFLYVLIHDLTIVYVVGTIDLVLSFFFLADFIRRYLAASDKMYYMVRDFGWADLLASFPLPQFKILRTIRLVKAYKLVHDAGGAAVFREFLRNRATGALYLILFLIILLLEFGSIAVLFAEKSSPDANITSASDAIWWVYVTITTVGYGDKYPTTNEGRLVGMIVMLVGVGLFAVLTGFLANKFLPSADETSAKPTEDDALLKLQNEVADMRLLLEQIAKKQESLGDNHH